MNKSRQIKFLPPPAATILLYAADGLSVWKGHLNPSGRPRMPQRSIWVPMFRELANSTDGLKTLRSLAEAGMQAWNCSADHLNCLESVFRDITFRALIIATLDNLYDVPREPVAPTGLSVSTRTPPAPPKPRPRPEAPRHDAPCRPPHRGRPHDRGPRPGFG